MSGRPEKHSLTLRGHATSVSLEPEFWAALRAIARGRGLPVARLAAEIDAARGPKPERGLAASLRVFVLAEALAGRVPHARPAPDPAASPQKDPCPCP